jgi:hypothetical protein
MNGFSTKFVVTFMFMLRRNGDYNGQVWKIKVHSHGHVRSTCVRDYEEEDEG